MNDFELSVSDLYCQLFLFVKMSIEILLSALSIKTIAWRKLSFSHKFKDIINVFQG